MFENISLDLYLRTKIFVKIFPDVRIFKTGRLYKTSLIFTNLNESIVCLRRNVDRKKKLTYALKRLLLKNAHSQRTLPFEAF